MVASATPNLPGVKVECRAPLAQEEFAQLAKELRTRTNVKQALDWLETQGATMDDIVRQDEFGFDILAQLTPNSWLTFDSN